MSLSVNDTPIVKVEEPAATLKKRLRRVFIAMVGCVVVILGIATIPTPVPSSPIMFVGLSIWAIEFHWAKRLLAYVKQRYDAVSDHMKQRSLAFKMSISSVMVAMTLAVIWLSNGLGYMSHLVGLHWAWLDSPLPFL